MAAAEEEEEDDAEAVLLTATALRATPTRPERTATSAGAPPGSSTFCPGDSVSLSAFAASQVAASSERREKGRNWVSQAVSSSAGVNNRSEGEGEEEEVEKKDESPMSTMASSSSSSPPLGPALASRSEGLSGLGTRTIDTRKDAAAAAADDDDLRVAGARSGGRTAAAR